MISPRRRALFLLSLAAFTFDPVAAAIPQASGPKPQGDATTGPLAAAINAAQRQDCAGVFSALEPTLPRLAGRDRNAAQLLRLPCLLSAGRSEEAGSAYREVSAADPADPLVRSIGVVIALSMNDYVTAASRLASLADDAPSTLERMTGAAAQSIVQGLTEQKEFAARGRLFIALARSSWQPIDRPELSEGLANGAIEALIDNGRGVEAADLLPRITAPDLLIGMAEERHYAALWPAIEQRLGEHSGDAIVRYAATRLDAYTSRPDDPLVRRDAVRAFIWLGRLQEAHEVAATVSISGRMNDNAITTVELDAQVLAAQGRLDDAVTRMTPLTALDLNDNPRASSGLIGLGEMLDENGRSEQALAIARTTLAKGATALSPWGANWLKRTEICSLAALGRGAEANRLADRLKDDATSNQGAAIEALLCADRKDEAAKLAVLALGTMEGAGELAAQFQPEGVLPAPARSRLRPLWKALLDRSDVAAAFSRSARILPMRLWPSRAPRATPRVFRPDDVPVT